MYSKADCGKAAKRKHFTVGKESPRNGRINKFDGVALLAEQSKSLIRGEFAFYRRVVRFTVEIGVVRLVFRKHMPNRGQESASDGNSSLFATAPLLKSVIFVFEFRMFVRLNGSERNLNKERLEIFARAPNTSSFLLARALLVN